MNFLAHAYLSFNKEPILIGNMISDFVKGKKKENFNPSIQIGIMLHRSIDNFTDHHAATKIIKDIFKPYVRLYASVFSDIVYDYFLANDISIFSNPEQLFQFSQKTYQILQQNYILLPEKFKQLLPYMIEYNWLYNYRTYHGINNSFKGVFRRAQYLSYTENAFNTFLKHQEELRNCYNAFFPEISAFTQTKLEELLTI